METTQLTYNSTAQGPSLYDKGISALQTVVEMLKSIFHFLLVIDAPQLQAHRTLINGLFFVYFLPCFIVFGVQAVIIMLAYQIGFKLLLRAVLYK